MWPGLGRGDRPPKAEAIDLLRLHASTRGLDERQLEKLVKHVEVVRLPEGEIVHRASDPINALLLVIFGRLKMSTALADGVDRTLQYLGPDDQFGLLALSGQELLPVDLVAEQNSALLRIPIEMAPQLLSEVPLWGRHLLGSLAPRLRETVLDDRLRRRPRIIALIHTTTESRAVTRALVERLSGLQESVGLLSDDKQTLQIGSGPVLPLLDSDGVTAAPEEIRKIVGEWPEVDRVILDVHIDRAAPQLVELTGACDAILWICSVAAADRVQAELAPILQAFPGWRDITYLVWMLSADQQVAPFAPQMSALFKQDFKLHWDGYGDSTASSRRAGIERIVHHLRGISIGLALGGGAARGMAHLGVLQVLEEAGIVIDRMSGTSAGALTGIVYAAGYTPDFLVKAFAHDLEPPWYQKMLPRGDSWYMLGKYRRGGWDSMLRKFLHDWRLEQLPIPFTSVAVDLVLAEKVLREQGDATHALLESINLPLLSNPICRDGMALVDGGILDVVPADVLVSQQSNVVIAVDVSASILTEFAGNRPDTPTDKMKTPTTAQTLSRVRLVQDRNIRSIGGGAADLVIEPDVATVDLADFKHAAETAALGQNAAEASLSDLRNILTQADSRLFPA